MMPNDAESLAELKARADVAITPNDQVVRCLEYFPRAGENIRHSIATCLDLSEGEKCPIWFSQNERMFLVKCGEASKMTPEGLVKL